MDSIRSDRVVHVCRKSPVRMPQFLTSGHCDAQSWASQCPDVKNYKWRLNPVWHRMLYSCTHMATEGFKGLTTVSRRCRSATGRDVFRTPCASPFQTTLILADGFFVENQNCLGIHYQKSCGLRGTSSNSPPTGVLPLDPTGDFLDPLLAIEGLGSLQWGPGAKLAHFFPAF